MRGRPGSGATTNITVSDACRSGCRRRVVSLPWTAVITVLACAQKLLPVKAGLDVPLALAIIGLGIWIILAPCSVPGLTPPL